MSCTSFKAMNPLIGDKPLGHPDKDIIIIGMKAARRALTHNHSCILLYNYALLVKLMIDFSNLIHWLRV